MNEINKQHIYKLEYSEKINHWGDKKEQEKIRYFLSNNPQLISKWNESDNSVSIFKNKKDIVNEKLLKLVKIEVLKNDETTYFKTSNSLCNVYTNKKYPEIEGLAFSNKANSDQLAFIEYLERLSSFNENEIFIKNIDDNKMLPLNTINHFWLEKQPKIEKKKLYVTKGKSLYSNKIKFVPSELVYYNVTNKNNQLFCGSSNGCAVGDTLEDATFRALLEFIERDSFMKFWFSNTPEKLIKRLNLKENNEVKLKEKMLFHMGYQLDFFKINSIPHLNVIWCLARSINNNNVIYSMSGLSCDIDLNTAINKSFEEMFVVLKIRNKEKNISIKIKNSEKEVKSDNSLNDILYYFSSYERKSLFENIINKIQYINIKHFHSNENNDYELNIILKELESVYSDIVVVDQTSYFLEKLGLKCAKVIVVDGWDVYFKEKRNNFGFDYQPIA